MDDPLYMDFALDLAARGEGSTSPNPIVGAVVVKGGRIIGRGYHRRPGGPHAEVFALDEAGEEARGSTLYVTLEPCCHFGRTPPCTERIIEAGVSRVVVAMVDPNPKVSGQGIAQLLRAGIEVEVGLRQKQAVSLNDAFIKFITTGIPLVVLKWAMTLDGKFATRTGSSRWITGPESREAVHRLRRRYDAVLVGRGTVEADDPELTCRLSEGAGRDPVRVILDSQGRIPRTARCLRSVSTAPTVVVVTEKAPADSIRRLEEVGAEVLVLPEEASPGRVLGRVPWSELLRALGKRGITGILVEGGSEVHASSLSAGVVDKVMAFLAPKIAGGKTAPGPVGGLGVDDIAAAIPLNIFSVSRYGSDLMIDLYNPRSPVAGYLEKTAPSGSKRVSEEGESDVYGAG